MTPAVKALERAGVTFEVLRYKHDSGADSYGLEAAEKLDLSPSQVFKTLIAQLDRGGLAMGLVPVNERLDLKALSAALGARGAVMADPKEAQRATGYLVGGISPLGQKRRLSSVIDDSASRFERIFVSAGRRGLELAVAPTDLVALLDARLAPLMRV